MDKTPEQRHSDLIDAIEYELTHYGPSSLADMIANLIDQRFDEDENPAEHEKWHPAAHEYENLGWRLAALGKMPEPVKT